MPRVDFYVLSQDAPDARLHTALRLIEKAYEHSQALNIASVFEIDDVIDPADTRRWILTAIRGHQPPPVHPKRRTHIDTW